MCGITGFWTSKPDRSDEHTLSQMNDALAHRGPDDRGLWLDDTTGVRLAQRRLSIIDLSAAGHQPMASHCSRYQMVYNGEIYNHLDIRRDLTDAGLAPDWRGHSDSETLLAAVTAWGFEAAVKRLNGMFAIVVWDSALRKMHIARDRMGEKPLFYGWMQGVFLFGSELKALVPHPAWVGEINRGSLTDFLKYATVPAPASIYRDIYKLPPAHMLEISSPEKQDLHSVPYWDLPAIAVNGTSNESMLELPDQKKILEEKLMSAVGMRMMADVPLGAFLSGGLDSSMIVAMMQAQSSTPVKTFTIGFQEQEYDEAPHAKAVADHLGTDHTELYVDSTRALDVLPRLPQIWDEPFADASQIPTLLVSQLTRQSVTVSLSGDGGDELFHGYSRYEDAVEKWGKLQRVPTWVRRCLGRIASDTALPLSALLMAVTGGKPAGLNRLLMKAGMLAQGVGASNEDALYDHMLSYIKQKLVLSEVGTNRAPNLSFPGLSRFPDRMMLNDMQRYLPDTILTKVDRASMAVGLEARAPFLDHGLVEYAWQLPLSLKQAEGQGKWLMRQVLYDYVPRSLVERPKMGFGVPIDHWLRGPLLDWAEQLLDEKKLKEQGFLKPAPIRQMWKAHRNGSYNYQYQLWPILSFQSWLETAN